MHWRITLEAVDPTGDDYRKEFMVARNLDELTEGKVGFGIEDGKSIMAQIQQIIVERELDLWVRYRRACPNCSGQLPLKDYRERTLLTVFGPVSLRVPRLLVCQRCHTGMCFSFSRSRTYARIARHLSCWNSPPRWARGSLIERRPKFWPPFCPARMQDSSPRCAIVR